MNAAARWSDLETLNRQLICMNVDKLRVSELSDARRHCSMGCEQTQIAILLLLRNLVVLVQTGRGVKTMFQTEKDKH